MEVVVAKPANPRVSGSAFSCRSDIAKPHQHEGARNHRHHPYYRDMERAAGKEGRPLILDVRQKEVCRKYNSEFVPAVGDQIVGISLNVKLGAKPIHGLRHPVGETTTGWFIWAGDYSSAPDFFKPVHFSHVHAWCPMVQIYLGLAPGWRFLVADSYQDVWFDEALIHERD